MAKGFVVEGIGSKKTLGTFWDEGTHYGNGGHL